MRMPDAYNVFRRIEEGALRCAVRQDKPVPAFVSEEGWAFEATVRPGEPPPAGFRERAAEAASTVPGFYIFHATDA